MSLDLDLFECFGTHVLILLSIEGITPHETMECRQKISVVFALNFLYSSKSDLSLNLDLFECFGMHVLILTEINRYERKYAQKLFVKGKVELYVSWWFYKRNEFGRGGYGGSNLFAFFL